jgi:hypothetical protein
MWEVVRSIAFTVVSLAEEMLEFPKEQRTSAILKEAKRR